jgi:hypothetical protein
MLATTRTIHGEYGVVRAAKLEETARWIWQLSNLPTTLLSKVGDAVYAHVSRCMQQLCENALERYRMAGLRNMLRVVRTL